MCLTLWFRCFKEAMEKFSSIANLLSIIEDLGASQGFWGRNIKTDVTKTVDRKYVLLRFT